MDIKYFNWKKKRDLEGICKNAYPSEGEFISKTKAYKCKLHLNRVCLKYTEPENCKFFDEVEELYEKIKKG